MGLPHVYIWDLIHVCLRSNVSTRLNSCIPPVAYVADHCSEFEDPLPVAASCGRARILKAKPLSENPEALV
jgi:hypothetical protein